MSTPPVAPYSASVRAGGFLIVSGQIGMRDGALVPGGVAAQLHQAVANLAAILFEEGLSLDDVRKTTVFLADIADYDEMNANYVQLFAEPRPARSAVGVSGLPRGALVEIEAWALTKPVFGSGAGGFDSSL
jgi:2-iminobutanoate/2-iminopropanoate deaminase